MGKKIGSGKRNVRALTEAEALASLEAATKAGSCPGGWTSGNVAETAADLISSHPSKRVRKAATDAVIVEADRVAASIISRATGRPIPSSCRVIGPNPPIGTMLALVGIGTLVPVWLPYLVVGTSWEAIFPSGSFQDFDGLIHRLSWMSLLFQSILVPPLVITALVCHWLRRKSG